jgi:hypothetical protein
MAAAEATVSEIGLRTEDLDFSSFSKIINGEKRSTKSTIHGINPATLEALYPVPVSTKADIDAAIVAARATIQNLEEDNR